MAGADWIELRLDRWPEDGDLGALIGAIRLPVLVAIRWSDEAEAIRMANDSHYGLAAYVWTHDIGRGLRAAHAIESGWVQVNQGGGQTPGMSYGGFKQSGPESVKLNSAIP